MRRCIGVLLLLLAVPGVGRSQQAPERLLPAQTQIYFRWDGIEAHRLAYAQTALGKMMQGQTGKFLTGVTGQLKENLGPMLTVPQLLGGAGPEQLQKIQAYAAEAPKVVEVIGKHGLIVGVELRSKEAPEFQAILIIPNSGQESKPLFSLLRLLAVTAKAEVKESKLADRSVSQVSLEPVHLAWWVEGADTVVTVGTDKPEALVKHITEKGTRLEENVLYQKVKGFKDFETAARAFVDVAALAKVVRGRGKDFGKVIDDLGLDNLQSMVLYSGFDGEAERSIVQWHLSGTERKGLFRVIGGKPFELKDLPPAPPDAVSISAVNLDLAAAYDVAVPVAETLVGTFSPGDKPKVKEVLKQADAALGIDIRKDLVGSLGPLFVHYSSPSEGALNFGEVFLFQVKDAPKLQATLDQAIKGLAASTGVNLQVKKRLFHGVEMREIHFKQQGVPFLPAYAIQKDWLIISYFPQPVQGYVLRSQGELRAWRPAPDVQKSLDKLPRQFIAVSITDPRPTIRQVLTLAPLVITLINSFTAEFNIDVGSLPNAQEATQHLFPNVSVVTGEGEMLRSETRASLSLPFELSGVDTFWLFFLFAGVAQFIFG